MNKSSLQDQEATLACDEEAIVALYAFRYNKTTTNFLIKC